MNQVLIFAVLLQCVMSANPVDEDYGPAEPYTFGYKVHDIDGDQWRSEHSDGQGRVQGTYGYVDNEGMKREVHYVADDDGFRANIKTNEPGMDVQNPANVVLNANPPSDDDTIYKSPSEVVKNINNFQLDYDATIYGIEAINNPEVKAVLPKPPLPIYKQPINVDLENKAMAGNLPSNTDPQGFYRYHKFAEPSVPPIYLVDGHLQSPWFPMDSPAARH